MFFAAKIANTVSALRVGFIAKHRYVKIRVSKYTTTILNKLQVVGLIETFYIQTIGFKKYAIITLAYIDGRPAYSKIKLISKPSKRYYISWRATQTLINSGAVIIISTSLGILTAEEALLKRVGGEVLLLLE